MQGERRGRGRGEKKGGGGDEESSYGSLKLLNWWLWEAL
jgi:hypothetical protein